MEIILVSGQLYGHFPIPRVSAYERGDRNNNLQASRASGEIIAYICSIFLDF